MINVMELDVRGRAHPFFMTRNRSIRAEAIQKRNRRICKISIGHEKKPVVHCVRKRMKTVTVVKRTIDILMSLSLLFLMGFPFWGQAAHEIAGVLMLALVIAHNAMNVAWYKSLFRGTYRAPRIILTAVNLLLLVCILATAASGIMMSNHVFSFLGIESGMYYARLAHLCGSYWCFVLMSLHLGLHWNVVASKAAAKLRGKKGAALAAGVLCLSAAVYGTVSFFRRGIPSYLFLRTQFAFMDPDESKIVFYLQYICMTVAFAAIAHWTTRLLSPARNRKH